MKSLLILFGLLFISPVWADGYLDSEKEVLDLVLEHWEARDSNDYATQANLMSPSGTYNANSDGSFFRFSPKLPLKTLRGIWELGLQV